MVVAAMTSSPLAAQSTTLTLEEGVVVKFGPDAGIEVRDAIQAHSNAVFSSINDDASAGQTQPTLGLPAPGDWRGISIAPSALPSQVNLNGAAIYYAGGSGAAGLEIVDNNPSFQRLLISIK